MPTAGAPSETTLPVKYPEVVPAKTFVPQYDQMRKTTIANANARPHRVRRFRSSVFKMRAHLHIVERSRSDRV